VLWLIDHGIDIQCVRIKPYRDGTRTLVDVQQIIPLPEARDYQIQLREKEKEERRQRSEKSNMYNKFWEGVIACSKQIGGRHANLTPGGRYWISAGSGRTGLYLNLVVMQNTSQAELYINRRNQAENKSVFDQLFAHRAEVESKFQFPIEWERLDNRDACRIKSVVEEGGLRRPETEWPTIHQALVERIASLEKALRPFLDTLEI